MSSTNKTTNYELSQFLGTDKPAWLSDYNTDMSKIDAQMKLNADAATAASGSATSANTAIGTLASLTTTDKTDLVSAVNEVNSKAGTAQNTANDASDAAATNATAISNLTSKFELTTNLSYAMNDLSVVSGTAVLNTGSDPILYVSRNSDGSVFKVYGAVLFTPSSSSVSIRIPTTGITTDEAYNILGSGICYVNGGSSLVIVPANLKINNGSIDIVVNNLGSGLHVARLFACLYFNTNFGDQPE